MGRAIDMENSIDRIDMRLKVIEDALQKVIETVDSMQEKSSKVEKVNLTDKKVKPKKEKESEVEEQKADGKRDRESSK